MAPPPLHHFIQETDHLQLSRQKKVYINWSAQNSSGWDSEVKTWSQHVELQVFQHVGVLSKRSHRGWRVQEGNLDGWSRGARVDGKRCKSSFLCARLPGLWVHEEQPRSIELYPSKAVATVVPRVQVDPFLTLGAISHLGRGTAGHSPAEPRWDIVYIVSFLPLY